MKKLSVVLFLVLAVSSCFAQNTTVSATITDSDSQTWNYGTWAISFVPGPSQPNPALYTVSGSPVSSAVLIQSGSLSSGGATGSIVVYNTADMAPSGSSWNIRICPLASQGCFNYNFTTSGSTLNLTTTLSALAAGPRFAAVAGSYGYSDTEVNDPIVGSSYWNVSSQCQRIYNAITSTWTCTGTATLATMETHSGLCSGAATAATLTGPTQFGSSPSSGACGAAFSASDGQVLNISGTTGKIACASQGHNGNSSSDGTCTINLCNTQTGGDGTCAAHDGSGNVLSCVIGINRSCIASGPFITIAGQTASCSILPASGTTAILNLTCTLLEYF